VPPPLAGVLPDKDVLTPTWMADAFINGKAEQDSLELEIAGFTGVSRSIAYNIPTMLSSDAASRQSHNLKWAEIVRKETEAVRIVLSSRERTRRSGSELARLPFTSRRN